MGQQPPVAFVVTLHPGASETEATVIRSALRGMRAVADVSPVQSTPAQDAATQRAKADLRAELTPIFAGLVQDVKGTLDATTEELVKITDPGRETPIDIAAEAAKLSRPQPVPDLPKQRRPVPPAHRNPVGSWQSLR